jgi:hypothetical protein
MSFHYADALQEHNWIGGGLDAYIYHVIPNYCGENCSSGPGP